MQDLRTGGDVTVEVEWAAEANVGLAGIELTDGSDPVDSEDSKAVRLLSLTGEKFAPLFSNRQRVWIDICGSANTATLYAPEDILARCASVDLSKLSVWKLRFLVIAGTSSGLPPSRVAARIHRVRATSIPSRSAVAGRVTDTITNRGIAGAVIRFGSDKVVSNPDGSFLLRTAPGKQLLHAEASGYTEVEPPLTTVSPGLRTSAELRMKRTRVGYGQVIASIPLAQKIDSFAPGPRGIYFTTSWEHGSRFLWHLPFTGGPATELGTISLAPAQKDFQDALTTGSPQFYDVGRGMAYADNVLYGIGAWPARIFRITAKGELSLVHRLPIDWPQGLVFDGKRFWFLENSGIDNRCGLQAIDAQTGQLVVNLPANDNKISGLAWGMGRFWVSSMAGRVYEIDIEQAADRKSLEGGSVNQFPGCYSQIAFDGGYLWGLDSDAKRLCKIKVGRDSE
jgi:hypothetical protein